MEMRIYKDEFNAVNAMAEKHKDLSLSGDVQRGKDSGRAFCRFEERDVGGIGCRDRRDGRRCSLGKERTEAGRTDRKGA